MMNTLERSQAFQELIMIFAEFFKFPEKEFFEEIVKGEIDRQVNALSQTAGCPVVTHFKEEVGTYEELVEAFNVCFLGVTAPFAPPVESVYKVWTTDESYQVPFKNQKGYLMGDSALHVQHILKAFNLEIPEEYEMMPDHLTILLELFAFLVGEGYMAEARQFKRDHLDWLPELRNALNEIGDNRPYIYVVDKLQDILAQDILAVELH